MDQKTIKETLQRGEVDLQGQFTLGSNYTFLVQVKYRQITLDAVYKPQKGEQPLWDFPEATLSGREVAAYMVSEYLELGLVPFTLFRKSGPYGAGSYQLFIPYDPNYHYFSFSPEDLENLKATAFFDLLCNNADRKGSHVLYSTEGHRLYAIDHGLCFHSEPKLRTVIWHFAGQPIPEVLIERLRKFVEQPQDLFQELAHYLDETELAALLQRAQELVEQPVFPHPPQDKRAFPFPPL